MSQIAVLGSTGMLGRAVAAIDFPNYKVIEINRHEKSVVEGNKHFRVDSSLNNLEKILNLNSIEYIVNCAGLIRQKIFEDDSSSVEEAINANVKIPTKLVALSEKYNFKILQIGTDCVYSGSKGKYLESDLHDARDLYGKSKSLGESPHKNLLVIRSSIIGLEADSANSLLSWFLSQPFKSSVEGFNDQFWNGVTVYHFAKVLAGIINKETFDSFSKVQHLIPADFVSKGDLLHMFSQNFDRPDIELILTSSGNPLDMRLSTESSTLNEKLWNDAGYLHPLSIEEMIIEYSLFTKLGVRCENK
jgi:dTDP-4-dehydrorhamnose reductase